MDNDTFKAEGFEDTLVEKLNELFDKIDNLEVKVDELIEKIEDLELTQNDGFQLSDG